MINHASIDAVSRAVFRDEFRRPLYGSYCFAGIPDTVRWLLTGEGRCGLPADTLPAGSAAGGYDRVILLLVDALGWRFVEPRLHDDPFLARIARDPERGVVSQITSQFPSTTAAHVTALHTGLPVGQSGVYEWHYYEPQVDDIISPLLFKRSRDRGSDSLAREGVAPRALFPNRTLYHRLGPAVRSFVYADRRFAHSPYNATVCAGAAVEPTATLADALSRLAQRVAEDQAGLDGRKAYHCVYFGDVDTVAHRYGPEAPQTAAEVDALFLVLEGLLHQRLHGALRNTLVLLTADHGQVRIDPERTVYLNRELPELIPLLRRNHAGRLLVPAGSPRDFFLHVRDNAAEAVYDLVATLLEGRAVVERVGALLEADFFGPRDTLSAHFLGRVGDLVVLPRAGESVWWAVESDWEETKRGHHGGVTPEEMESVLLAYAYRAGGSSVIENPHFDPEQVR